jgi:hypothetical protein
VRYRKRILVQAFWSEDGATYHKQWGDQMHKGGHWVIIGPNGNVYGCEPNVFAQTYELVEPVQNLYHKTAEVTARQIEKDMSIETIEGPAFGRPGDWLITNQTGEQYFISHSVFIETYEAVLPDEYPPNPTSEG